MPLIVGGGGGFGFVIGGITTDLSPFGSPDPSSPAGPALVRADPRLSHPSRAPQSFGPERASLVCLSIVA